MLTLIKILHLFGLMLGAGGGLGGMMLAIQAKRSSGEGLGAIAAMRPRFTMITFTGVALLWITGLWLWIATYDGAYLGTLFALKLIAALFVLGVAALGLYAVRRARAKPGTPPPAILQKLGPLAGLASYIAVALAVIIFG